MSKTCKKATLFTVILTVILAAAIVIGAILGFNQGATVTDKKMLTVSMNQFAYETQMDDVKAECEKAFGDAKVSYEIHGEMSGDESEVVFVFDKDVDVNAIAENLNATFADLTKEGAAWYGTFVKAIPHAETTMDFVAEGYVLRAVIAGVVFAVLAFLYVAIRYKWYNGVVAALAVVFAMSTTAAIVLFARIPVTAATMYAVAVSGLFAAIASVLAINRSAEDSAKKEILWSCGVVAAAILLAGIGGGIAGSWANFWFSVCAVIGLAVAALLGILYVPAVCEALKPVAEAKEAAKDKFAYKGAKKTSTKVKKASVAAAPVEETVEEEVADEVAETEENPCCCCEKECNKQQEEPVEEAEEVVEETAEAEEEVAEEAVEEPTEAPEEVETVETEATEEVAEVEEEKKED